MRKLTKLFNFLLLLTTLVFFSCAYKSAHSKKQKEVTVSELITNRNVQKLKNFDDSIYNNMPDITFITVSQDVIKEIHPKTIDDITESAIVNKYLSNKVLYDGICRGYNLRKLDERINKLVDNPDSTDTIFNVHVTH